MKKHVLKSLWVFILVALLIPLSGKSTTFTTHLSPIYGTEYSYSVAGTCPSCTVTTPENLADDVLGNYTNISMPSGTGTGVKFRAKLSADFTGPGFAGFLVENASQLLDVSDLADITVYTYYQGVKVDSLTGAGSLGLIMYSGAQQYIEIQHSNTIDEVAIEFAGRASAVWSIDVYYGYANNTTILPVEFLAFDGNVVANQVQITWTTAQEINNNYFMVERSSEGNVWETLARVEGAGNAQTPTDYQFIDINPIVGMNLYRLKQVDYDGAATLSSILWMDIDAAEETIHVGPNPTASNLNLMFQGAEDAEYNVQVFDNKGSLLYTEVINSSGTAFSRQLDLSTLPEGIYFLRLTRPGKAWTERLMVAR